MLPECRNLRAHYSYLEYASPSDVPYRKTRRATDYVIRTKFLREPSGSSNDELNSGKHVNLVLRLRSLLHRRTQSLTPHDARNVHFQADKKANRSNEATSQINVENAQPLSEARDIYMKRNSSDSCLRQANTHLHGELATAKHCVRNRDDSSVTSSPISDRVSDSDHSFRSPDVTGRLQSLSTGNICCLYALNCLPSVEYIPAALDPSSPTARRRSYPASSLKATRNNNCGWEGTLRDPKFAFSSLRGHPCYQDVRHKLKDWIKQTMDEGSCTDGEKGDNWEKNDLVRTSFYTLSTSDLCRHVRFADEATDSSSMTTLQSISASSSTRSLSSASLTPFSTSPCSSLSHLGAISPSPTYVVPCKTNPSVRRAHTHSKGFFRKLSLNRHPASESKPDEGKSKKDHSEKATSLARRIWHRKRGKKHRECKTTPMFTVNVIQDYSEPPEVPLHVLRQLRHEQERRLHWKPAFANPETCLNFITRLEQQKICLGSVDSKSIKSADIQVQVLSSNPFRRNGVMEVRLRYTLDDWVNYTESDPLVRIHSERKELPHSGLHWVETYAIGLRFDRPTDETFWGKKTGRFEFAVVLRKNGVETWDNNNRENYLCTEQFLSI
ncbi:unnamed protein product [Calicophoron daubneyi]|uniref:CBM21 domain-containing protein n=1 Tax=Calicophoron daubneyi TaxID=300641 RepID=A0AAV2TEF9_CALDB